MNGKQYLMTQITIIQLGKAISSLDLKAFLKCINNAEAIAPTLDPTLFKQAQENLSAIRTIAEKLESVKGDFEKFSKTISDTTLAYLTKDNEPSKPGVES